MTYTIVMNEHVMLQDNIGVRYTNPIRELLIRFLIF